MMTWRDHFEMGVGIYVAALGQEKPAMMCREAIEAGFSVTVRDEQGAYASAMQSAYAFVQWKLGLGSRPEWVVV